MESESLQLSGLILLKPSVFSDSRGFFYESYRKERYREVGIDCEFVQDNISFSVKNVVRGLHYQEAPGQAKLIAALQGTIWDVVVDIREDSPSFGKWAAVELSEKNYYQLFVPIGFAHGFCVLSETATVSYKVSAPYDGKTERTLLWNDPAFGIQWPVAEPILSERDLAAIPNIIQDLAADAFRSPRFAAGEAGAEAGHVENMADGRGCKDGASKCVSGQILNDVRYKPLGNQR